MRKKRIMVLAGSLWQIPLIKKIKNLGYEVINVNPYADSPAFAYADEQVMIDILDKEKCLEYAKSINVDAVMSEQCDIASPSVAYVAEKLGLKTIGCKQAELYTNKLRMREFCQEHEMAYPEYQICYSLQEARVFWEKLNKKMIIKPLDSNSSRGIFIIDNLDALKAHFEEAMSFSRIEKAIICERYIEGTEFTVDGIVTEQGHYSLAISEKSHYKHNPNIACTLFFSYYSDEFDYDVLRKINDQYVDSTGLPFGLTHAEYKYEDGKYYLIEIGARGGGNLIGSDIVPLVSGIDNYQYLIDASLGNVINEKIEITEKYKNRCAVLQFFDTPQDGGRVKAIIGEKYLIENPYIVVYKLNFKVGDIIEKATNDSARIGFYIAYEESKEKLQQLMKEVNQVFSIEVEK